MYPKALRAATNSAIRRHRRNSHFSDVIGPADDVYS